MPLVRVQIRNEYRLGAPELYREANPEEPKTVLEGVSVSGLVGILRQLGDLAEFSAEVFHDLQEQVMATAARSHRIIDRVKHIEASLSPVEKAVLAQKNHIHFAYSVGTDWHANIQTRHNHLNDSDLPQFILECYEECRDPPRLHLLDKFDTGGPGACLKRYSDPSIFKSALPEYEHVHVEKVRRGKKAHKSKKKGSRKMNVEVSQAVLLSKRNGRMQFTSPSYGPNSTAESISTFGMRSKSDRGDSSTSSGSRSRLGYRDSISDVSYSIRHEEREDSEVLISRLKIHSDDIPSSVFPDEQNGGSGNDLVNCPSQEKTVPCSSSITWDEKTEIVKPIISQQFDNIVEEYGEVSDVQPESSGRNKPESGSDENIYPDDILTSPINSYPVDSLRYNEYIPESLVDGNQFDEIESELDNYTDAPNNPVSETTPNSEQQKKQGANPTSSNLETIEIECRRHTVHEMNTQNSELSDVKPYAASEIYSNKQMLPSCSNAVASKDSVHSESPPIISMCPEVLPYRVIQGANPTSSDLKSVEIECRTNAIHEMNAQSSESCDVIPNAASEIYSNKLIFQSCSDTVSSKDSVHAVSPPTIFMCPKQEVSVVTDLCLGIDVPDVSRANGLGIAVCDSSSTGLTIPSSKAVLDDKIINNVCDSQESHAVSSGPSTLFWTNGGLLGLEPSKPLESTVLSPVGKVPSRQGTKGDKYALTGSTATPPKSQFDGCMRKQDVLNSSPEPSEKNPSFTERRDRSRDIGLSSVDLSHVNVPSPEAHQEKIKHSSSILGLSERFPVNSFRSKISDRDTSSPSSSLKSGLMKLQETHVYEQVNRSVHQISPSPSPKRQFEHGSPANSLSSSSPPVEHMTISFHPINGFGTSKLNLRFPNGQNFHGGVKDIMFPSFQLVPEPSNSQRDIDYESDNDTFSRLSNYLSDDVMSQQSFPNSEQWESNGTPRSKDLEIYDALHRVSSEESITSSFEQGTSHTSFLSGLPNFDSMSPIASNRERENDGKDLDCAMQYPDEPIERSLPPLEWMVKPPYPNDLQTPVPTTLQQPTPTPPKQPNNEEATSSPPKSKDHQRDRESKQTPNIKDPNGEEDLLNLIRTKSLRLKRTVPAKSTLMPNLTANSKVTAILEKANAIRQAFVGSDEGEDSESWSDH